MNQHPLSQQPKVRYKVYATLLDSFQYFKVSQSDNAFSEFIDKVNRVPFESEKAEKGTAFNELVDRYLKGEEISIEKGLMGQGRFWFDESIVKQMASKLTGAISQIYVSGYLQTDRGLVELYGWMDELVPGVEQVDIKTTSSYSFPKYLNAWQKVVYPFCTHQHTGYESLFTYLITDFKEVYDESYQFKAERDTAKLRNVCEELIEFLETYRHLITDKKVFAEEVVIAEYDKDVNAIMVSNA